jgi:acetolactate synthase-1/2/3 large subunit
VHHRLPLKLFVFNNSGYVSIKHTMQTYFGRMVACDPSSGLSCPDTLKIAKAYGLPAESISISEGLGERLEVLLSKAGPVVVDVKIDPMQPFVPKVQSEKKPDGTMVSKPLDDMYPYLSRETYAKETQEFRKGGG